MKFKLLEVLQFITLLVVLFASSIVFNKTASQLGRFFIILIDALLYVVWGVWHHYAKDRFDKVILLEYCLVSLLIVILAALGLGIVRFI